MSVEKIIQFIEREAEDEAARIVADAEAEVRGSVATAEAEVEARVVDTLERVGPELRAESRRRVNAVRLRALEERARDDAARLSAVFDAAEERLVGIAAGADEGRWSATLARLCSDALDSVGEGASVAIRSRDAPSIAAVARRWDARVRRLDDATQAGLVATSADGRVEVDASLVVRMERARSLLAESVAQMLALEPGGAGYTAAE